MAIAEQLELAQASGEAVVQPSSTEVFELCNDLIGLHNLASLNRFAGWTAFHDGRTAYFAQNPLSAPDQRSAMMIELLSVPETATSHETVVKVERFEVNKAQSWPTLEYYTLHRESGWMSRFGSKVMPWRIESDGLGLCTVVAAAGTDDGAYQDLHTLVQGVRQSFEAQPPAPVAVQKRRRFGRLLGRRATRGDA